MMRGSDSLSAEPGGALPLFDSPIPSAVDRERLGRQEAAVLALMRDGAWRSLRQISEATGAPEASASARLRDLRRDGWTVERDNRGGGLWAYRVRGDK